MKNKIVTIKLFMVLRGPKYSKEWYNLDHRVLPLLVKKQNTHKKNMGLLL